MSEHFATANILCPQCGAALQVHASGSEVQPEDRVVCPLHGDLGSYAEFQPAVKDAVAKAAHGALREMFGELFRRIGAKPD